MVVDIRKAGIGGSAPAADATGGAFGSGSGSGGAAQRPITHGHRVDPGHWGRWVRRAVRAAGAAGIAGAAVAGGLAAAKHEPGDRTAADTQAVDVGKAGGRAPTGPTADRAPTCRDPTAEAVRGGHCTGIR